MVRYSMLEEGQSEKEVALERCLVFLGTWTIATSLLISWFDFPFWSNTTTTLDLTPIRRSLRLVFAAAWNRRLYTTTRHRRSNWIVVKSGTRSATNTTGYRRIGTNGARLNTAPRRTLPEQIGVGTDSTCTVASAVRNKDTCYMVNDSPLSCFDDFFLFALFLFIIGTVRNFF